MSYTATPVAQTPEEKSRVRLDEIRDKRNTYHQRGCILRLAIYQLWLNMAAVEHQRKFESLIDNEG